MSSRRCSSHRPTPVGHMAAARRAVTATPESEENAVVARIR
ncbi:hypothetical protein [Streptomyces sp. AK02-01A]|nr:hypothetical protein [Streptomyces sp. AK02-01A]MDX3855190.1 hypothetical protein [Streptomyces sp. AK02-01A]